MHRDLHPGNFLIDEYAAICDFGQSGTDGNEKICLNLDVLPPELLKENGKRRRGEFKQSADIWSFGRALQFNIERQVHEELNSEFGIHF